MRFYIAQRLVLSVVMLWVVATGLFLFVHLLPGDPAQVILGGSEVFQPSPEQLALVRERLGLDKPLLEQYLNYIGGLLRGDLGVSFLTSRPVATELGLRFVRTLMLVIPSLLLSSLIGIVIGVAAARARGRWVDGVLSSIGLLGHSLPVFVVGSVLVLFFSIQNKLLPSSGYVDFDTDPNHFFSYLVLPVTALTIGRVATTMRMTRTAMVEHLLRDYVRTARAKGLSERIVTYRHVFRNAMLPVVTVIGLQAGNLFTGALVVEAIFNWPGLNSLLIRALGDRDYPLILGRCWSVPPYLSSLTCLPIWPTPL